MVWCVSYGSLEAVDWSFHKFGGEGVKMSCVIYCAAMCHFLSSRTSSNIQLIHGFIVCSIVCKESFVGDCSIGVTLSGCNSYHHSYYLVSLLEPYT